MANTCFVISPIGEAGSEQRIRADKILKHVIKPAVEPLDYVVIRADQISSPGLITSDIVRSIADAALVIADMTGHNPNVFYELAVAHSLLKPVISVMEAGETIPFDVSNSRIIFINHTDLDSVANCIEAIKAQVASIATESVPLDNPISIALTIRSLKMSENSFERTQGEILEGVQKIITKIDEVRQISRGWSIEAVLDPSLLQSPARRAREREFARAVSGKSILLIGVESTHDSLGVPEQTEISERLEQITKQMSDKFPGLNVTYYRRPEFNEILRSKMFHTNDFVIAPVGWETDALLQWVFSEYPWAKAKFIGLVEYSRGTLSTYSKWIDDLPCTVTYEEDATYYDNLEDTISNILYAICVRESRKG